MSSSPEPNKATPNSDAKGHSDNHTATLTEQVPPQQEADLNLNKLHLEQDPENLVKDGREQTEHQDVPRRRLRGLSLRAKATALAIAIGTLPVLAIGATAYYFANQSIVKQIVRIQVIWKCLKCFSGNAFDENLDYSYYQ